MSWSIPDASASVDASIVQTDGDMYALEWDIDDDGSAYPAIRMAGGQLMRLEVTDGPAVGSAKATSSPEEPAALEVKTDDRNTQDEPEPPPKPVGIIGLSSSEEEKVMAELG
jgi:hypothetical protein